VERVKAMGVVGEKLEGWRRRSDGEALAGAERAGLIALVILFDFFLSR